MAERLNIITIMILIFGCSCLCITSENKIALSESFAVANVHFEQNATDGDVEVVFELKGGDEGLLKLKVVSPDGRTVVDFTAPDASTMGIRQFRFESPEPGDVKSLKAAYPEGIYSFTASSTDGIEYFGESTLNHKLPATIFFVNPTEEEENVEIKNLKITWTPVKNIAAYIIEIEQENLNVKIRARLIATESSFSIPEGFLSPGMEYKISVGTESETGNLSFVETSFTTAGAK